MTTQPSLRELFPGEVPIGTLVTPRNPERLWYKACEGAIGEVFESDQRMVSVRWLTRPSPFDVDEYEGCDKMFLDFVSGDIPASPPIPYEGP